MVPLRPHELPGRLISFDGLDGAGKTTQIEHVRANLEIRGCEVVVTSSPSAELRQLSAWTRWHTQPSLRDDIDEFGLTLMALGDRLINQASTILPALSRGAIVLSDRYVLSILAYWATPVHEYALRRLVSPDLAFYLAVNATVAADRIRQRKEPIENSSLELITELHDRYEVLAPLYSSVIVDTSTADSSASNHVLQRVTSLIDEAMF